MSLLSETTYYMGAKFTIWEMVKRHAHTLTIRHSMTTQNGKGWDVSLEDANSIGLTLNYRPFATIKAAQEACGAAYSLNAKVIK